MLRKLLDENLIVFHKEFNSWEDAIKAGAQPLIDTNKITSEYTEAMINSVNEFGPYIVLAPNLAMPHATIGAAGVLDTATSLMVVEEAVSFAEGDPSKDAKLFITICASDEAKHMDNIMAVSTLFSNQALVDDLIESRSVEDIENLIEKYSL